MNIEMTDELQDKIIKIRKRFASSSNGSEEDVAKRITEIMLMQSDFTAMMCEMHNVSMKILKDEIHNHANEYNISIEVLKKPLDVIIDNAEISAIYNILDARREKMVLVNRRDNATYKLINELCAVYEKSQNMVSVNKGGKT